MVDEVRRAYGALAGRYVGLFGRTSAMHPDDLALIDRHLGGCSGSVLDAGCGPGHVTAHLRRRGVDATGVDLTPELLDHARAADPQGRYVRASIDRLPAADGSLDGAVAWYSLIHLPPNALAPALAELRRVLRLGGTLVVGFFDGPVVGPFDHKVTEAWSWPADELADRLAAAGFAETERRQRAEEADPFVRAHGALVATAV